MTEEVDVTANGAQVDWRTAIAEVQDDRLIVRGYDLKDLIGELTFTAMVMLVFTGEKPSDGQVATLDSIFVAVADHGISPSTTIARYLASCGVALQVAVASGVSSFGDIHGGAGEGLAQTLQREAGAGGNADVVAERVLAHYTAIGERVPGFGHPQHPQGDPRVPRLLEIASEHGVAGRHTDVVLALQRQLSSRIGRDIAMNIDGIVASLLLDLGLSWRLARALMFIPRTAGLAAHVVEEWEREPGWRHVRGDDVYYDGPRPPETVDGAR
jgi:citrate synthase/citryl-CoA lyase